MSVGLNFPNLKNIGFIVNKEDMVVEVESMDTLEEDGKVQEGTVEVSKSIASKEGIEVDWIAGKDS